MLRKRCCLARAIPPLDQIAGPTPGSRRVGYRLRERVNRTSLPRESTDLHPAALPSACLAEGRWETESRPPIPSCRSSLVRCRSPVCRAANENLYFRHLSTYKGQVF